MGGFEKDVKKLVKVPLNQNQFDSLVSFTYNCAFRGPRQEHPPEETQRQGLRRGRAEFHKWNKANGKALKGLTRRRASEALMFQGIPDLNFDGKPDPMPQMVDDPDGTVP